MKKIIEGYPTTEVDQLIACNHHTVGAIEDAVLVMCGLRIIGIHDFPVFMTNYSAQDFSALRSEVEPSIDEMAAAARDLLLAIGYELKFAILFANAVRHSGWLYEEDFRKCARDKNDHEPEPLDSKLELEQPELALQLQSLNDIPSSVFLKRTMLTMIELGNGPDYPPNAVPLVELRST